MEAPTEKSRSLVSSLWVNYNMAPPAERCGKFHSRSDIPFRHLIDSLLIDDEVFVPTQDFMALPVFLRRLGGGPFLELLESGAFKFVRFPGAIGYAGGGFGIMVFGIQYPDGRQRPITASTADAARAALESVGMFADRAFISALENATVELDVKEAFEPIARETYTDVQQSESLRTWFASRSQTFQKLEGIQHNQTRIYGGPDVDWVGGEINVLLALATANLELRMAQLLSCANSTSTSPVQEVIAAKVARTRAAGFSRGFTSLRQLADIPDVSTGVLNDPATLKDILKLRGKSKCRRVSEVVPTPPSGRTWRSGKGVCCVAAGNALRTEIAATGGPISCNHVCRIRTCSGTSGGSRSNSGRQLPD